VLGDDGAIEIMGEWYSLKAHQEKEHIYRYDGELQENTSQKERFNSGFRV
jgi:hypothetical protein